MWKIFAIFIYFINVCNCQFVLCPGLEDEVTKIPGLNVSPNFRQFAGYLEATNNTFFYYWFFESQNQQSDPLVLWLNGGPGCSSVMGALTENGPFRLNKDGSLSFNDFSWNKRVNILYLESPAGVGFSYKNGGNNLITGDTETAINNHEALKSFFLKFPYLMENDFYIAGESYGGMYIPTLSSLIVQTQYPRNFKGIAIGNGYLDETLNGNSMLQYAYYHGLYDISLWKQLHNHCCSANETIADYCDYVSKQNRQCKNTISLINQQLYNQPLNLYDIYGKCEHNTNYAKSLFDVQFTREYAEKRYIKKRLLKLDGEVGDQTDPPCMNFGYADAWLNQKSVRSALNVRQESNYWTTCNPHITTTYVHEFKSMRQTIQYLHKKGLRILIYNGDADYMCAYLGDHWFVESLGLRTTKAYQPWMYKDQIGGYMKGFDNLIFATVRGAGHTVPTDRPEILKNPVISINKSQYTVYENGQEWLVVNMTIIKKTNPILIPKQFLEMLSNDNSTKIARNWFKDVWVAIQEQSIYWYKNGKIEHKNLMIPECRVNAIFFNPIDQNFYAISTNQIFIVEIDLKPEILNVNKDLSNVKLVLFIDSYLFYMVENFRYWKCVIKTGNMSFKMEFECMEIGNSNILCPEKFESETSSDTFFWFSVAGLVASLIILLLIFLLYPGDSSPPVLGRNGASSITIKTMIGENDLKRETSINSKNTTCKFQAKINLIPIKQKRKTIPRITKSS